MSQPRRRRRRRRKSGGDARRQAIERSRGQDDDRQPSQREPSRSRRSRGRRGRTRARQERATSPQSSEDLVRAAPKKPPARLTRPHDGTTLEQVIGELQSNHGVPQNPQEYRLTLRIAEERGDKATVVEEAQDPVTAGERLSSTGANGAPPSAEVDRPRREKAPAAPRIGSGESAAGASEGSMRRRSRKRRRRSKRGPGSA